MTSHPTVAAKKTEVGSESEEGGEVPADREKEGERESGSEPHSPPPAAVTSE